MSTQELILPEPTPSQREVMDDPARYKVLQVGRRGGKTRLAFVVCCAGHGAKPNGRGMLDGGQICWMPSTVPQGRAVWREEVLPRFSGVPGFTINESERRVTAPNGGSLEIVSAEGCSAAQGRRFDGVFLDEPRDYDVEHIWKNIIRPTLIDRRGWAIFGSATRAGSGFNQLCKDVETGKRPGNWKKWHWRTQDNPALPKEEFEELKIEYPIEDVSGQQELLALLLDGIAGVAFPEFVPEVGKGIHVVPTRIPPRHWKYVACLDWGFVKGCYALAAVGPEGQVEFVYERILTREHAREAALACWRESSMWPIPQSISYDVAMDYDAGLKQGTTLTDEWLAGMLLANGNRLEGLPAMIPAKHTPGSRPARKNLFHKMLKYSEARNTAGFLEPWALPRLRFQQQCKYLIETMKSIPLDERNPEDVDTNADDHCLVAGTLVTTERGKVPIEAVSTSDRVLTRTGWQPVLRAWLTQPSAEVFTVETDDGKTITMTAGHPVFTERAGFVRCDELLFGDQLTGEDAWKPSPSSIHGNRNGWASGTGSVDSISADQTRGLAASRVGEPISTAPYGNRYTDPFPQITTSTTGMETEPTTSPETWKCSHAGSTSDATATTRVQKNSPPSAKTSCTVLPGINGSLESNVRCPRERPRSPAASAPLPVPALCAVIPSPHGGPPASTVTPTAIKVRSVRAAGRAPVYNLSVHHSAEFFANGILVHNCYDAAGYLLVTLQDLARPLDIPAPKPDQHPGMSKDGRKREVPVWERAMRDVESPNKYWTPP